MQHNKFIPKSLLEIVIPIGEAKLITTQDNIDEALEVASHIFADKGDSRMDVKLDTIDELEVESKEHLTVDSKQVEIDEADLIVLSESELSALPTAKFGRDKYGRSLTKSGEPRKGRSDKGNKRGSYKNKAPDLD